MRLYGVYVYVHGCVHVLKLEWCQASSWAALGLRIWNSLSRNLWLIWLVTVFQEASCVWLSSAEVRDACHHAQLLHGTLGLELRSSRSCGGHSSEGAISPGQSSGACLKFFNRMQEICFHNTQSYKSISRVSVYLSKWSSKWLKTGKVGNWRYVHAYTLDPMGHVSLWTGMPNPCALPKFFSYETSDAS